MKMSRAAAGTLAVAATLLALNGPAVSQAQPPMVTSSGLCGPLENAFGPFDYRTVDAQSKYLVEKEHFTPPIETLRAGRSGTLGGEIDYTLRAIPNHPRALMAMVRLGDRYKSTQPRGARYPVECYFDRAVRFAPDDPMIRVLYGDYLAKRGRGSEARQHLSVAEANGSDNAQVVYNLGLAYVELKDYEKAVGFAKSAKDMGIQFMGLQEKLQRAGKWPG